ncbi:MAG TPA: adenylate/guanylate cyclase domain-containing protein, partial [Spirochaetes bacterium]|nr:adenylate/guanylate cyclase domain-containing protein [Spirochaetota bacterium]
KRDEIGDMTRSFNTMVHGLQGFTQYVSKDVVKQILESGDSRIAGTSRKVAIFFSDIRSFTTITEKNSAKEVVEMLNNYFDLMVPIIIESGGNLDKFIGDAVMAEWGGIKPSDRDPYDSCFAAVAQREALAKFNEERRNRGTFEVKIGMGINYGDAIVGTLGSESKMEFTVIGDAVNLASRLEGLTKEYAVDIIISHSIAERVQDEYVCCELDKVAVKGKAEGIRIYELVGRKSDDISAQRLDEIKLYEEALSLYQRQEFETCIKTVQSIRSDNTASKRLLTQAKMFIADPPPVGWDGTSVKTTK